jgi:DNA-binding FadR family transcriptional regulator
MEKQELAPILAKVYLMIRQYAEMALELSNGHKALLDALCERDPNLALVYMKHLEDIQTGEQGQGNALLFAAFDQAIAAVKLGNL